MVLKIRLRQQGRTNRQTYRLVVTDIRNPRDGKYLEMLGWYNPFSQKGEAEVDVARIQHWVSQGAQITPSAQTMIARVAPHVISELRSKEHAKRGKQVAKRRAGKKGQAA